MINIGSRRECFFDDYLLDVGKTTARLCVHQPVRKEAVLIHNEPWEGDGCTYHNFFWDNERNIYRMYYLARRMGDEEKRLMAAEDDKKKKKNYARMCYAESHDGVNWIKPNLGLYEYEGSYDNNIVSDNPQTFFVFYDSNPQCPPEEKYKAIYMKGVEGDLLGSCRSCLFCKFSSDGFNFGNDRMIAQPPDENPFFDSLNLAFWDENKKKYFCYFRGSHAPYDETPPENYAYKNEKRLIVRDIRVMESEDFINWSDPYILDYGNAEDVNLYTNNVQPYYRAPHIYIGFPNRYTCREKWTANYDELCSSELRKKWCSLNERWGLAITDSLFMASHNGKDFKRYDSAFLRPGPERPYNWFYGVSALIYGMVETPSEMAGADPEISMFVKEGEWSNEDSSLYRYSIRLDGFASITSEEKECMVTTKPFIYEGKELRVNFSTSARG